MSRLFALVFAVSRLSAQIPAPVGPLEYLAPEKDRLRAAVKHTLPSLRAVLARPGEHALHPVTRGEIAAVRGPKDLPLAGIHRRLEVDLSQLGRWDRLPDGRVLFRAAIHSPAAAALRLEIADFDAGAGRLWIHSAEGQIDGPYTGRGPFDDGSFWTETISGNSVTIEYEAAGAGTPQTIPFRVAAVAHVFPGFLETTQPEREAAAPCHLDSTCFPEWAETARSAARLVFEKDGGSYFCSGTLLNTRNSSRIPYFLTANHCIDTDAVARTVQAFWFYQTGACNGTPPATRDLPRSNGARLLATGDENQGDYSLLRLTDVPSGVFFAGWNAEEVAMDTPLTGIHHPAGDYKRISFGARKSFPTAAGLLGPNVGYTVTWTRGHTEGGSSGSGLFLSPGVLVGTLTGGLRAPTGGTKCDINPDSSFYGRFSAYYPNIRDFLEDRTTAPPTTPTAPAGVTALTSGVPASFSLPAVFSATLLSTPTYSITVPAGAGRLTVRLATSTSNVDTDLYVRFGTAPAVSGGRVVADHTSASASGIESITIDGTSNPVLRQGTYFISIGVFTTGLPAQGTITATLESGGGSQPSATATRLTSGNGTTFSLPGVTGSTLFESPLYYVEVPAGATRLTVRVTTTTPRVDVDLHVRYDKAPEVQNRQIVSDHSSTSDGGDETVTITPSSSPPLKGGIYYVALALFTTGVPVQGSIVATIEGGTAPPPNGGSVQLTSGTPREFNLPVVNSGSVFTGSQYLYSIQVPQGATRLTVRVQTATPNADVDLYVRYNTAPAVQNQQVVADYRSASDGGDETVTVTPGSSPPLQAGTYYIALGLFTTGVAPRGTITATVESGSTPPAGQPVQLTSGAARQFDLPAIQSATLFNAPGSTYTIQVPQNAVRLTVRVQTATPGADVDLFVRYGSAPELAGSSVVSDHRSTGDAGDETVTVTSTSSPGLRAGTYYIALALFTRGTVVRGSITATVETGSTAPPPTGGPAQLTSNSARQFDLDPVSSPTLLNAQTNLYTVQVPQGATRLQVRITTATPNVDVDLYVNFNSAPRVADGRVQADHRAETDGTGNETITILPASSPALRPGTYFIAMAVFTPGTAIRGTITATVDTPATPPVSGGSRVLSSGEPAGFQYAAVQQPTLFGGDLNYRVTVPEGATRLQVRVTSSDPAVDVDLYVRYGAAVDAQGGRVNADYSSETETGNESVSITAASTPALRPGTYYIALSLYSIGAPASGTITATIEREVPAIRTGTPLTPGQPLTIEVPAADRPTFYSAAAGFYIDVPDGAPGLNVRLETSPAGVDIDLFVRYGREPELQDGRIVADHRSTSDTGIELVSVGPGSSPPLRPGTYFIAIANYTSNAAATVSLSAEIGAATDEPVVRKESPELRKEKPRAVSAALLPARSGITAEAPLPEVEK